MPEPTASQAQLANIDCLICHQVKYKRVKSGGVFIPDTANMAITMNQAVQTVHQPVRTSCLQCHARAGGGDAYKRGDITLAHGNTTDTTFDRHMATTGANLECQDCHRVANHRIAGRGSDLAPTDYDFPMGCSTTECHATKDSPAGHTTKAVNRHVDRVACQTCHIKTYGKNAGDTAASEATEFHRDWTVPHFNSATGLWHPTSYLKNNITPIYKFWNRYSTNYLLYDVTAPNPITKNYTTSEPVGSINDLTTASKLYPFKYKTAYQPIATSLNILIALDTSVYWATGDYLAAVAAGLVNMGLRSSEPYRFVNTDENQLITHGVPPASQVLTCNECHGPATAPERNLKNLGYKLKNTQQMVCTQCHKWEDDQMSFTELHQKHIQEEGRGCSWCHNFSRPERGLNENYQSYVLTVSKPGTGKGTVASADGAIKCGADCTETYGVNTLVSLTATPDMGSTLTSWTGCDAVNGKVCTVTMNTTRSVIALFTADSSLSDPQGMAASDSVLYGDFGTGGIWKYDGVWSRITQSNPENMVASNSVLYGDFGPGGIWKYNGSPNDWTKIAPSNPELMAGAGSDLYGDFGAGGIWKYNGTPNSWIKIALANPEAMAEGGSDLYGDFGSGGIWKYNGVWSRITQSNPENMVASGSVLYGDFGLDGIWKYDGVWSRITP